MPQSRTNLHAAWPELPFLFGADVYPELQSRSEWMSMLDVLQRAHMNVVRVSESAWGHLEPAPGKFSFGWLRDFLDELERRGMRAILGTGTFIPPQWLVASHPETLVHLLPGLPSHPLSRHSPCLNHPRYRDACRNYIRAVGGEFKQHPTIIAWQLDNEIELILPLICYNPACETAWQTWLRNTYATPEAFNQSLGLSSWGMQVQRFEDVPQPRQGVEGTADVHLAGTTPIRQSLPALSLAHLRFARDVVIDFLSEQAQALRDAGVRQPILTDWNETWTAVADDPRVPEFMSIAGFNLYPPSEDRPAAWRESPWHFDMHRSAHGTGRFLVTETRFGVMGQTAIWDPAQSREQYRMWNLVLAAFGACGLLYWTGNRWRGGHWPHWGGLLDWTGKPEIDFEWAVELGDLLGTWGPALLANPVKASALVLTDFDQRSALQIYPHVPSSLSVLPETFHALHRLGIGTDSMNLTAAEDAERLKPYALVLIPAATALHNSRTVAALREYVQAGGTLLISPFTAYTDWNGVFRGDGFAANLSELTATLVRTVRWMGSPANGGKQQLNVRWNGAGLSGTSPAGLDGLCEILEVSPPAQVIAEFVSDQEIVHGRPAATRTAVGAGSVIKLGFWPQDDSLLSLLQSLIPAGHGLLDRPLPDGVLAVPRADDSLFVINVSSREQPIALRHAAIDRLSGKRISEQVTLHGYQVLWLESPH